MYRGVRRTLFVGGTVRSPDLLLAGFELHFRTGRPDDAHADDVDVRTRSGFALGPLARLRPESVVRAGGGRGCGRRGGHRSSCLGRVPLSLRGNDATDAAVVLCRRRSRRRIFLSARRCGRQTMQTVVAGEVERRLGW